MRIAITGASGKLGCYLVRHLAATDRVVAWSGSSRGQIAGVPFRTLDLTAVDRVAEAMRVARPQLVIHTAASSVVADCHQHPTRAAAVNQRATERLAELAADYRARLIFTSTDLVFDGQDPPYNEAARPHPLSVYSRTKEAAEQAVLRYEQHVVARVSLLFGPSLLGRDSYFQQQVEALRRGERLSLFRDEWRTPLGLANAAEALAQLAKSDFCGLLHLGGPERMSRLDMGQRLALFLGIDQTSIEAVDQASVIFAEPRPRDVSLDSTRWRQEFPRARWLSWEDALADMNLQATR